jgi:thiamine biosynthesis lipoprotein
MSFAGQTMGTDWSVRIVSPPAGIATAIQAVLDRVVAQMSNWEHGSDIGRFNRTMPGRWQMLPPEFTVVLAAALEIACASNGAFDPTTGTLVDLWGFGPAGAVAGTPDADAIAAALAEAGHDGLELDSLGLRARRMRRASLDFSGIAKGFGVDQVAEMLLAQGVHHFLVNVGGELRGAGHKPDGQPWWVDLETPPGVAMPITRVALHALSIATSGDYRRWWDHGGRRYTHSIDPRTGRPIDNDVRSATVLHPSCMRADAWATALTVLGPKAGMALADTQGLAALIVTGTDQAMSRAMCEMLD